MFDAFQRKSVNPIFIIADLGLTCGGDLDRSLQLIEEASRLGADAVKFQMIDSDELLGDKSVEYTYPTLKNENITENMYEMFLGLEFTDQEWSQIKSHCQMLNLELIVTCHVESAVERIERLDLKINKICTWSLSHYRMISKLAKNHKPLILDTGTINIHELQHLQSFYQENGGGKLYILYDFHTNQLEQMNFSSISSLIQSGFEVGYTPQGRKDWLDYMSIGLGAKFLEKRLTLSRELAENGHWKAHNPDDFQAWIRNIKECCDSLGDGILKASDQDLEDAKKYYKSAYLSCDVQKGQSISEDHFDFKRPGLGISSKRILTNYIGKAYKSSFVKGQLFLDD